MQHHTNSSNFSLFPTCVLQTVCACALSGEYAYFCKVGEDGPKVVMLDAKQLRHKVCEFALS